MLTLIVGRAKTGKTNYIMNEILRRMNANETGMLLVVPEQYSHEAERQLCAVCGDRLSLHGEVLSFTRLCTNVFEELGRAGSKILDKSGQILVMHRALESVAPSLKVLGLRRMRTEITENLLETIKELKSLSITPQTLESAASQTVEPLSGKLCDLALIFDAYDALLATHGGDSSERLTLLADTIGESSVGSNGHIYFDGFNDFTAQEVTIIEELLRKKAGVTISLTCDPGNENEEFEIPNKTVSQLKRLAEQLGVVHKTHQIQSPVASLPTNTGFLTDNARAHTTPSSAHPEFLTCQSETSTASSSTHPELVFLERHIFDTVSPKYPGKSEAITVVEAPTRFAECEFAVSTVIDLVKNGYRWRDIAIMAREWEEYASLCENIFEKYEVPYFSTGKADILGKPPLALIDAALEIATTGWEYKAVLRYLKLGLIDITTKDCALLENYVTKWQIRGSLWTKEWKMPPSGYGREHENDEEKLSKLNKLRKAVTSPLMKLRGNIKGDSSVEVKLRELYAYLVDIGLSERLVKKAKDFDKRGEMRMADEYTQLWDIIVNTMNQMYNILGDKSLSPIEFKKLILLAFSQNDVGVIPVSLDRVALGGMQMSRRRNIKCLILLGASDDKLPMLTKQSGTLTDNERIVLRELGADIPAGFEDRYCREMNMLYSTLTQSAEKLIVSYSTESGSRPSFIVKNLCKIFDIAVSYPSDKANIENTLPKSDVQKNIRENLTEQTATELYGEKVSLSATRVDSYYSCAFKHFMTYGLRLEQQKLAEFDAMTAGNFMHYVLDGVFREIKEGAGIKDIDEKSEQQLTEQYIDSFISEKLFDFEGKNKRFMHLFKHYQTDTKYIVNDMINELKNSDFEPLNFELNMRELSDTQTGFIDRVDGYSCDDKLFLRVIDYKTRKKAYKFDMADVLQGRDMQMLIYLFALTKYGHSHYGQEIEPAGVLYVPARDVVLNASRNDTEEEINRKRIDEMRRSGLVLHNDDILNAMEKGDTKKYLPLKKSKTGEFVGESLVDSGQMDMLSQHVSKMISNAEKEILGGATQCSPYYKNENENACSFCEYSDVCGFDEEMGDERRRVKKMGDSEVWGILGDRK